MRDKDNDKKLLLENERLKTLLYNAIVWIDEECSDFFHCDDINKIKWFENVIGINLDELTKLGCDWLVEDNN